MRRRNPSAFQPSVLRGVFARAVASTCAALTLLCVFAAAAAAQVSQGSRNTTPPGLAPGAPVGAYALSGFENINLYSGNLNFTLPLLKVGGRGRVGASVNLSIDSTRWDTYFAPREDNYDEFQPPRPRGIDAADYGIFQDRTHVVCTLVTVTVIGADDTPVAVPRCQTVWDYSDPVPMPGAEMFGALRFAPRSAVTKYALYPMARSQRSPEDLMVGYGPGVVRNHYADGEESVIYQPNPYNNYYYVSIRTLYRMTFVGPDGTEHELTDTLRDGQPIDHPVNETVQRGRIFVSTDGSQLTFVSDVPLTDQQGGPDPTGYLFFPDGTRSRVENGVIRWTRDSDGNSVTYTYDEHRLVTEIKDTLGRRVTITYGSASASYDEIRFNGVGGTLDRSIKVWYTQLGNALRDGQTLKSVKELFPKTQRINPPADPEKHNPVVTSAVEMPDGRKYQIKYNSYGEIARVDLPTGAAIEYDYTDTLFTPRGIFRRIKERRASEHHSPTGGDDWEQVQKYTFGFVAGFQVNSIAGWSTNVTVETHDVKGGGDALVSRERHSYYGHPMLSTAPQVFYAPWREGREYMTEQLETSGAAPRVLRRTEMEWRQRTTPAWWATYPSSSFETNVNNAPARDPRVVTTTATVEPYEGGANLVSKTTSVDPSDATGNTVGFDRFNNRTDVWEYDFGTGGQAGPLLRRTHTDFVQALNVGGTTYDYVCSPDTTCGQTVDAAGVVQLNSDPQNFIHIRGLPSATEVRDAAGNVVSRGELRYDEPNRLGDDYTLPADFFGWAAPSTPARGHLTTARAWLDTLGGYQEQSAYLETHTQYDRFGNAFKAWDARGKSSEVKFSPDYKYALPTQTISADPDGTGPLSPLTTSTIYDLASGVVTDTYGANGEHTHAEYEAGANKLDRLKRVTRPDGGWTEYEYGDAPGSLYLHTKTLRESTPREGAPPVEMVLEGYQFFDGMGRAVRSTGKTGAEKWAATATEYDGVGRAVRATNPYETSDNTGAVPQGALWTSTEYDALGRAWKVTTPDGAQVVTHFDGLRTLVTDQAGVQRLSKADALGRLAEVWEVRTADSATGTEAVTFPHFEDVPDVAAGYKTTYAYDVLGNLRKVEQGGPSGQHRYFAYDSLSRLLRAKNPEQESLAALQLPAGLVSPLSDSNNGWSLKYEYDEAGNLKKRTDARGVETSYVYDALNRVTDRSYTDVLLPLGGAVKTPPVKYYYDNQELPAGHPSFTPGKSLGRLVAVTYGAASSATGSYTGEYDEMGHPHYSAQVTALPDASGQPVAQPPYVFGYEYNLDGSLKRETYPSGKVVESEYDEAGRLAGVKKQGGEYYAGGAPTGAVDSNAISYTVYGAVAALRLGNGLWEHTRYNNRLQIEEIGLGTSRTDSSVLKLEYGYGAPTPSGTSDPTKNNGNVRSQRISVPAVEQTPAQTFIQTYTYDALNRLEAAGESNASGSTWAQVYQYDRYGNRRLDATQTTSPKLTGQTQTAQPAVANPSLQSLTNRIAEDQDGNGQKEYTYDAAGNMTCDAQHCAPAPSPTPYYDYDGESKLARAGGGVPVGGSEYVYDGGGLRVKKVAGAVTTVFVYDAAGRLAAEYGNEQRPAQTSYTSYVTQDALGSTRIVTGQGKEVKGRYDYLPFGQEATEGRDGYGGETVRQKFTGYERDAETNLDYAQARHYANVQGRFMSVDPLMASGQVDNPQSFNRYSYVANNPLNLMDPTGLAPKCPDSPCAGEEGDDGPAEQINSESLSREWLAVIGQRFYDYINGLIDEDYTPSQINMMTGVNILNHPPTAQALSSANGTAEYFEWYIKNTPLLGSYYSAMKSGHDYNLGRASGAEVGFNIAMVPVDFAGMVQGGGGKKVAVAAGEAGSYAKLSGRAVVGDLLEAHHMPQAAMGFTTRAEGGALVLTHAEHVLTRTYGRAGAIMAEAERGQAFRTVLARDIRDVRAIVGSRYNQGLRELTEYYRTNFPWLISK